MFLRNSHFILLLWKDRNFTYKFWWFCFFFKQIYQPVIHRELYNNPKSRKYLWDSDASPPSVYGPSVPISYTDSSHTLILLSLFLHTEVNKIMFLLDPRECICITSMDIRSHPHTYSQLGVFKRGLSIFVVLCKITSQRFLSVVMVNDLNWVETLLMPKVSFSVSTHALLFAATSFAFVPFCTHSLQHQWFQITYCYSS